MPCNQPCAAVCVQARVVCLIAEHVFRGFNFLAPTHAGAPCRAAELSFLRSSANRSIRQSMHSFEEGAQRTHGK